jgi:hypothetical protein
MATEGLRSQAVEMGARARRRGRRERASRRARGPRVEPSVGEIDGVVDELRASQPERGLDERRPDAFEGRHEASRAGAIRLT